MARHPAVILARAEEAVKAAEEKVAEGIPGAINLALDSYRHRDVIECLVAIYDEITED